MNESSLSFRVLDIIRGTTVDGPGFRTAIYFAGCSHQCPGCHNPDSWNPGNGISLSLNEILAVVDDEDFDVTLTGGDPLYNPDKIGILVNELKKNRRNIWIYTGFNWEDILKKQYLLNAIKEADVLVDGKFVESLRNTDLRFKGSSNQRIIDIKKSLESKSLVLFLK